MIICGFPGIGKTTAAKDRDNVIDIDSQKYHYIPANVVNFVNPNFSKDYVVVLQALDKEYPDKYILASCHEKVRKELDKQGVPYIIVAPHSWLHSEYMLRYVKRRDRAKLINKINKHWYKWIAHIAKDKKHAVVWLDSGEYLSDVLGKHTELTV